MRPDHSHEVIPRRLGPPTVRKAHSQEGSCFLSISHAGDINDNCTHILTTFPLSDLLGINENYVPYSMNKRKRWTLTSTIVDRLEHLRHNLRVSIRTRDFDYEYRSTIDKSGSDVGYARSSHSSATTGGKVTRHAARKGRQQMRNLVHRLDNDKPWNARDDRWAAVKFNYRDRRSYLVEDEDAVHKHGHVVYTVLEKATRSSANSNLPAKRHASIFSNISVQRFPLKPQLSLLSKELKRDRPTRNHSKRICVELSENEEEEYVEDGEEFIVPYSCPTIASSLSSFVISSVPNRTRNHSKCERKRLFEDEQFLSPTKRRNLIRIPKPTTWSWQEEDNVSEEIIEDIVVVESPSRIVLATALPQLFTRLSLNETALQDHSTMPVFPRSWEVHRQDTAHVLERAYPVCIIAKELNDGEIGLFSQENCLRCSDKWGRFRLLFEDDDLPSRTEIKSAACGVCCRTLNESGLNEHARPFALACGHTSCTGCWLRRVSDGMKKGALPTTCPDSSCTATLMIPTAAALLDSASLRAYADAVSEALLRQQKIARCSWCSRLRRVISSRPYIRCECGCVVCARCSSPAHLPVSCETYREYYRFIDRYVGMSTDIFWSCVPSFIKKRPLGLAFDVRLEYIAQRSELDIRLQCLSTRSRKEFSDVLAALAHLGQMCALHSGQSRRCLILAQRIQFAMHYFFDTKDRNRRNLLRKTEFMKMIMKDIVRELFS